MGISYLRKEGRGQDGQGDIIYPPFVRPLVLADKNGQADKRPLEQNNNWMASRAALITECFFQHSRVLGERSRNMKLLSAS